MHEPYYLTTAIAYTSRKVTSPVNSLTSGGGAIYTAMRIAPNSPVKYTDGSWAYGGGNTNPVAILEDGGRSVTSTDEFSLLEVLKLDIMKGWSVSATYNLTATNALRDILKKTLLKNCSFLVRRYLSGRGARRYQILKTLLRLLGFTAFR